MKHILYSSVISDVNNRFCEEKSRCHHLFIQSLIICFSFLFCSFSETWHSLSSWTKVCHLPIFFKTFNIICWSQLFSQDVKYTGLSYYPIFRFFCEQRFTENRRVSLSLYIGSSPSVMGSVWYFFYLITLGTADNDSDYS